jgi:hypothetical protein
MLKYKIEGGLDFYTELYKSLDDSDAEDKIDDESNMCLIENTPLTDKYVEMVCGHKFNYIPLYLDIKNHKQKFNGLESSSGRLNQDEIRCPYCRQKQKQVLPYYEELGLEKLHGINYINPNYKSFNSSAGYYKTCQFILPNPHFDPSGNNIVETNKNNDGNCKFLQCFVLGSQINYYHGMLDGVNYGDENYYCWSHKKVVIKKYKKELSDKAKLDVKEAKLKEKEEAKLAKQKEKEEAKLKAKEDKLKAKEDKFKAFKQIKNENIVLGPVIIDEANTDTENTSDIVSGCIEILKSGPNKGKPCGGKIVTGSTCKRHSK